MGKVSATGYLVLVPDIRGSGTSQYVRAVRISKVTVGKPVLGSGEIAVKIILNFDEATLIRAIPEIEVDVKGFSTPITDMFAGPK